VQQLAVDMLEPSPFQPRQEMDEAALQELADSIAQRGILQPLLVRPTPGRPDHYQIIAGERRWRAAQRISLHEVPVLVRPLSDSDAMAAGLVENLQREDLNAMEIALSYKRMMEELNYTQEQVAERMGKERSTVANYIRLLRLPPDIQVAVRNNQLSMGHARALINVDTVDKQLFLFAEIKRKGLSVRQTEELVRQLYKENAAVKTSVKPSLPEAFKRIEDNLASHFSTRVKLNHNKKGEGSISIEYYSLQELNKLLDQLGVSVN
jgi:ParB family chromosome partitioning protein